MKTVSKNATVRVESADKAPGRDFIFDVYGQRFTMYWQASNRPGREYINTKTLMAERLMREWNEYIAMYGGVDPKELDQIPDL